MFLSMSWLAACAQEAQTPRRVPHEVLAFYYTWYGSPERHSSWVHWNRVDADKHYISDSTHYPAKGAYDSYDPETIDRQIEQAKGSGLTGFIATWWGQGTYEDKAFSVVLKRAEEKNFKVTIYWETEPGQGPGQIEQAVKDLDYVLSHYGSSPAFLKVESRPVIFVYGRVMQQVLRASWPQIIQQAHAKAGNFMLIADGYRADNAELFDGVHEYNNCGSVKGKSPEELRAWAGKHYANAVGVARKNNRVSCLTVIPGYDDTKIRKPGLKAERQDGNVYRVMWEEAIRARPDWVLITSWNEWHEGSEIEPSLEFGEQYLTLTREYSRRFMAN